MGSSLKARIERLARSMPRAAGKFVVILPTYDRDARPIAQSQCGTHVSLNVPASERAEDEDDFNPREHLTDEQRAMIGPHDTVINVHYVRKPLPHA